ncbi:uncharacterized protein LOC101849487 [Aplysia californica]|uniref:Uncharacterized protein LOC101849487 n=1 Tax=Aplysia californica TaxID=6500 RepID=A0ABM1VZQ5_APLCA|nr:uncharacterized protein LOC101849487 [Aplysia californica]XP_012942647.1 uncharacterized protein LOC101849487 [Aplysia californica]XP_035827898.1 uncharacterized protein LOC101849487 [Aplysia californica]
MADTSSPFVKNLEVIIGSSFTGSILSLAYELGILQALMDAMEPMTSQQVADGTNLKERYVRECLNCLVCAQIVEASKDGGGTVRYHVTPELGVALQSSSTQMIGMLASQFMRYKGIMDCFKKEGPYSYPFAEDMESMAGIDKVSASKMELERELILSNMPGLREKLESGINVIEIGSGRGSALCDLAQKFPNSKFTGSEYVQSAVQILQDKVKKLNLSNIEMVQLDILDIPDAYTGKFDFLLINDVIHDLPNPLGGLKGCRKVLKTGSHFAFMEIDGTGDVTANKDVPGCSLLYGVSIFNCVPQAYQSEDSTAYGACWGRAEAARLAGEAGFKVVSQHNHSGFFVLHACQAV